MYNAVVTVLQIQGAGDDPVTRAAALISLICALVILLFGCVSFNSIDEAYTLGAHLG